MWLALALATVTILLTFVIAEEATKWGEAVATRFLERGSGIPPEGTPITAASLKAWALDPANARAVRGYATRIMPWDILFLVCLGGFLGQGSASLAATIAWPGAIHCPPWLFWIFPTVYMLADLGEDLQIRRLLLNPAAIDQSSFDLTRLATRIKMWTAGISFLQLLLVLAIGVVTR